MKYISFITGSVILFSATAFAEHPCKDKADAKMDAHKALMQCIGTLGSNSAEDCTAKLNAFLEQAKAYKVCRVDEEKKDVHKTCGEQRDANQAAHKAFRECISAWNEDTTTHDADPSNRCSTELATVAKTEKALATCRKTAPAKSAPKPKK